jgi:hypothetical protein
VFIRDFEQTALSESVEVKRKVARRVNSTVREKLIHDSGRAILYIFNVTEVVDCS